jgi:isoleucyl-tRNA synthetase
MFNILKPETQFPSYYKGHDFNPSIQSNKKGSVLIIDGPPYANGNLHMGHLLNKTIKDVINRRNGQDSLYKEFIAGWDCHGLPIELKVKRSANPLETRNNCRQLALKTVEQHKESLTKLGINYSNTYRTLDNEFQLYELSILQELYNKELIYRGNKPTYWSIKNRTALAESEIIYKEVEVNTAYVKFKVNSTANDNIYYIAWTTTPWTLLGNKALAINSEIEYYIYSRGNLHYISNIKFYEEFNNLFGDSILLEKVKGSELLSKYHTYTNLNGDICKVIEANSLVTDSVGTSIVHINPSHGFDDYNLGLVNGLEVKDLFHKTGGYIEYEDFKYTPEELSEFIILNNDSILHCSKQVIKTFFDERTENPVYIRPTAQWFLDINSIKESVIKELENVEFHPLQAKKALSNTISSREEWCISRQRKWGIPIPYVIDSKGKVHMVIDSFLSKINEYKDLVEDYMDLWWDLPVEEFTNIPHCHKGEDVLDVWFDSGCVYLYQTKEESIPLETIFIEGVDQYRGWFQSSLIITYALKEQIPFSKLLVHGFTLDERGNKMSKSKGNVTNPLDLLKTYSSDILRLLVLNQDFTKDIILSETVETQMVSLYNDFRNIIKFILGNIKDFKPSNYPSSFYTPLDNFIIQQFNEELKSCNEEYNYYNFHLVINSIQELKRIMSSYSNLSKDRLYIDGINSNERVGCQYVLFYLLQGFIKVLEPICPSLVNETSIYLDSNLLENPVEFNLLEQVYDFNTLNPTRDEVNLTFERYKTNKEAKSKLDLKVEFPIDLVQTLSLDNLSKELISCYLGVSELLFSISINELSISLSEKNKCPRCWNKVDLYETIVNNQSTKLCSRCKQLET